MDPVSAIGNPAMANALRATSSVETIVGQISTTGSVGSNAFGKVINAELMEEATIQTLLDKMMEFVTSLNTLRVEQPIVSAMTERGNTTEHVETSVLDCGNHVKERPIFGKGFPESLGLFSVFRKQISR